MEKQTDYYDIIEIWISTHLSTFEPEFGNFLSTPSSHSDTKQRFLKSVKDCFS